MDYEFMNDMNPRTVSVYKSQMKKMCQSLDVEFFETCFMEENEEKLDKYIEDIENINTRKNYLACIVTFLKNMDMPDTLVKYRTQMLGLCAILNNVAKSQTKSATQEDKWMTLKELQDIRKNMFKTLKEKADPTWQDIQPFIASSLYLADDLNPPIRNEYGDMIVVNEKDQIHIADKSRNYMVITGRNKKTFILNDYKTAKHYGQKQFKVGNKLNKIINMFIDKHPISTGNEPEAPLLLNSANKMMGRNGLTKYLSKHLKLSTAMLRHIYISEKVGGPMLKQKEDLAEKMCHSTTLQEEYKKDLTQGC
tara:strand:- start:465 stop:1388 length:924 start_codon:yes stop_codon:yes gene_type:complete